MNESKAWSFWSRFAGSTIEVKGWDDKSADNQRTPDPTVDVRFGLSGVDEMFIGYFEYYEI